MYEFTADWHSMHIPTWTLFLSGLRGGRFLEIGTHEGRSALWLADNVMGDGARLTCIDTWEQPEFEERFDANLAKCVRRKQVVKIKGQSARVLRNLPDASFDAIYIDGDHEAPAVLTDAVLALPLLARGGLLIFDDYTMTTPCRIPPRPAIDAFLKAFETQLVVVHLGSQVIARKVAA